MSRPFRLGLVGVGAIAQAYLQLADRSEDLCVAAVVDVDRGRREQAADACGARAFATVEDLAAGLVDGVVVATPPATHVALASRALAAGMPVLCEKPLATTAADARTLVGEAARLGVPLQMATKYRYVDEVVAVRDRVREGGFGAVLGAVNTFSGRVEAAGRWSSDPAQSGGGVIIDNGTHAVDLLAFVLGPITEVLTVEGPRVQLLDVEDTAIVMVRTAEGTIGEVHLTWSADLRAEDFLVVRGTEAIAELGWKRSRLCTRGGDWIPIGDGYRKLDAMGGALQDFVRLVRDGVEPRVRLAEAVADAAVIDAAYESMRSGGTWTKVAV